MAAMTDEREQADDREKLARDRTDYAEDRTLLANERTFSGWARTSMAAIGIGLGFHVLFAKLEPPWVPKAIASLFILLGIFLIFAAERRAMILKKRLDSHAVRPLNSLNLRIIAFAISAGAAALIAAIWILI